ncbi:MAG: hypothetical protein ABSC06_39485 [Rhodopila sp.]|jgi:hypothetical protein
MSGSQATQIHNERTKLTATWLNGLATAATAAGAIAPAAAASFGISGGQFGWRFIVGTVTWLSVGLGLHYVARRVLGRLR